MSLVCQELEAHRSHVNNLPAILLAGTLRTASLIAALGGADSSALLTR